MLNNSLSWGNIQFPDQENVDADSEDAINNALNYPKKKNHFALAHGNGMSYGDVSIPLNGPLITLSRLNKIISFDTDTGLIKVEAGATISDVLDAVINEGWILPVVPGTKRVTIGGAIANDIHGKNHQKNGTFGAHLKKIKLIRSDIEQVVCSSNENADLFNATIGGIGLTGVIVWAEIQLEKLQSTELITKTVRFNSLSDYILLTNDHNHDYESGWIDLGVMNELGRGILIFADHVDSNIFSIKKQRSIRIPLLPRACLINKFFINVFNTLYFHSNPKYEAIGRSHLYDYFFPLDKVSNWNVAYGSRGLKQYQCVFPANSIGAIETIISLIKESGIKSPLAVIKRFGDKKSPGLMSFPMKGIAIAMDFPVSKDLDALFDKFDEVVRSSNGRIYLAKDFHLKPNGFKQQYPLWGQLNAMKDPAISSLLWNRVSEL